MFAKQWFGKVDDVVVVDDHITGVLSEHQAGKLLGVPETGIKLKGRRSTPGRYFQVAEPGTSWGGTDIEDPLTILGKFNAKKAWPGLRLLMVSTTGEHYGFFELDEDLNPRERELPADFQVTYPGARRPDRRRRVDAHGVGIAASERGVEDAFLLLAHGGFDFADRRVRPDAGRRRVAGGVVGPAWPWRLRPRPPLQLVGRYA